MKDLKEKGWVRLYRKIEDNPLYFLEPFTKAQAWIDLFLNANHKSGIIGIRGNILTIKRGQIGWSELTMAKRWGWSRDKVRNFLKYLETIQQIKQQKDRFITTIITILNYDEYQEDTKTIQQTIQQKNSRPYINKNVKNVKNTIKGEKISRKLVNTLLQERRLQRPDGDYARDNIYPARTLSKMIGDLIKERTGKEAMDDDKIDRFKYIINHLSDFDLPNATKISYFTRNWNRIINKLKE